MNRRLTGPWPALGLEAPYQVVMIAAMLELLLLAALAPRSNGTAPLCFESVAGLRLVALLVLGVMLGTNARRRPFEGTEATPPVAEAPASRWRGFEPLLPLALWGLILLPPELWAFALEAREGLPISALLSIALAVGCAAALRLQPRLGWLFPLAIVGVLLLRGFSLTLPSPTLIALALGGVALLLWRTP